MLFRRAWYIADSTFAPGGTKLSRSARLSETPVSRSTSRLSTAVSISAARTRSAATRSAAIFWTSSPIRICRVTLNPTFWATASGSSTSSGALVGADSPASASALLGMRMR